jgi:calcineurin-like phosphoesterase family protein
VPKVWVTADPHFFHDNIIRYEDRPFANSDEMNEGIISAWNQKVKKQDKLIIAGDVGLGPVERFEEILSRINGTKILVLGNHDRANIKRWMDIGISEVYKYHILYRDFFLISHYPLYMNDHMPYINIYGHVHGNANYQTWGRNGLCVSVERHNYFPVCFDDIVEYYSNLKRSGKND